MMILGKMDCRDLIRNCWCVNKRWRLFLSDEGFWREKAIIDFKIEAAYFHIPGIPPQERYFQIWSQYNFTPGSERYTGPERASILVSEKQSREDLDYLLDRYIFNTNEAMFRFGKFGNGELANRILEKLLARGEDLLAISGPVGHELPELGYNDYLVALDYFMAGALSSDNWNLFVEYHGKMISRLDAMSIQVYGVPELINHELGIPLHGAALSGNSDLVECFLVYVDVFPNTFLDDYELGLQGAIYTRDLSAVKTWVELRLADDFNAALCVALEVNDLPIIKYLLSQDYIYDPITIYQKAGEVASVDAQFLLHENLGPVGTGEIAALYRGAILGQRFAILDEMDKYPTLMTPAFFNLALYWAVPTENYHLYVRYLKLGAVWSESGFLQVIMMHRDDLIRLIALTIDLYPKSALTRPSLMVAQALTTQNLRLLSTILETSHSLFRRDLRRNEIPFLLSCCIDSEQEDILRHYERNLPIDSEDE